MILTEYDENEFRDFLKEEAWNEGHKAGMEDGDVYKRHKKRL